MNGELGIRPGSFFPVFCVVALWEALAPRRTRIIPNQGSLDATAEFTAAALLSDRRGEDGEKAFFRGFLRVGRSFRILKKSDGVLFITEDIGATEVHLSNTMEARTAMTLIPSVSVW